MQNEWPDRFPLTEVGIVIALSLQACRELAGLTFKAARGSTSAPTTILAPCIR